MSGSTFYWVGGSVLGLAIAAIVVRRAWRACLEASEADWGTPLLNALDGLNRLFCRRYHGFISDQVPLPDSGPAVVAGNHLSGLDPLLMFASCKRPLRFIIAREEYDRWWMRWLYRRARLIPVDRAGKPEQAFYEASRALSQGDVVAVFPEGAIRRAGDEDRPLKRGVIMLAGRARAPIIPVRVSGIRGRGRVVAAVFMRSNARLRAGEPISVAGPRDESALKSLREFITARDEGPNCAPGPVIHQN